MPAVLSNPIALTTNIADVPGVGAKRAASFRKLGIRGVADLILHLPMRYQHELAEQTIAAAGEIIGPIHGAEVNLSLRGEVAAVRAPMPGNRRAPFTATLSDETGTAKLSWFNAPWMRGKLHPGMKIIATGKCKRHGDYLEMVNAKWQEESEGNRHEASGTSAQSRLIPIYPATES